MHRTVEGMNAGIWGSESGPMVCAYIGSPDDSVADMEVSGRLEQVAADFLLSGGFALQAPWAARAHATMPLEDLPDGTRAFQFWELFSQAGTRTWPERWPSRHHEIFIGDRTTARQIAHYFAEDTPASLRRCSSGP